MTGTPFGDAVDAYFELIPTPFSTPGHKRNPLVFDDDVLLRDAPYFGGADTLRAENRVLEAAEALAAQAYGADFCRFTHNGSTHPNQALVLATTRPGEPVLVARTCHKSVYCGLILSGARPVWIAPEIDADLGLAMGTRPESVGNPVRHHRPGTRDHGRAGCPVALGGSSPRRGRPSSPRGDSRCSGRGRRGAQASVLGLA